MVIRLAVLIALLPFLQVQAPRNLRVSGNNVATYYVAKTGNDANAGTLAQPKLTIQAGVGLLGPGDTLYIRTGTYVEIISDLAYALPSGTAGNPIVISNYQNEVVTLFQPPGAYPQNSTVEFATGTGYITIRGIKIDGDDRGASAVKVQFGATNIRFEDCEVTQGNNNGMLWGGDNGTVTNCNIHHNALSGAGYGVYHSGDGNVFEGNEIHHNSSYGLHIYGNDGGNKNSTFRKNEIHDNGVNECAIGILVGGENQLVEANLIWNENGGGIQVQYTGPNNVRVYFNTIYNVGNGCGGGGVQAGIYVGLDAVDTIVRNNIVASSAGGNAISNNGTGSTVSHNLSSDTPGFVDASTFNFHLQASSNAINAGIAIGGITTDFDGVTRSSPPSVGAFEFTTGGGGGGEPGPEEEPPPEEVGTWSTPLMIGEPNSMVSVFPIAGIDYAGAVNIKTGRIEAYPSSGRIRIVYNVQEPADVANTWDLWTQIYLADNTLTSAYEFHNTVALQDNTQFLVGDSTVFEYNGNEYVAMPIGQIHSPYLAIWQDTTSAGAPTHQVQLTSVEIHADSFGSLQPDINVRWVESDQHLVVIFGTHLNSGADEWAVYKTIEPPFTIASPSAAGQPQALQIGPIWPPNSLARTGSEVVEIAGQVHIFKLTSGHFGVPSTSFYSILETYSVDDDLPTASTFTLADFIAENT